MPRHAAASATAEANPYSLSRRLLVAVSVPLVLFFGVTIAVLDANFRELSAQSLRDLLEAQMVALIAAVEPESSGRLAVASPAAESRLETPGSGLYAEIRQKGGERLWRSPSSAGTFVDFGPDPQDGGTHFSAGALPDGTRLSLATREISWEDEAGTTRRYVFGVAASLAPYEEQLWSFRRRLFGWFTGLALALLGTLGVLLRWTLAPVRRLAREIVDVEEGRRTALGEGYPRELAGVTANLNALLEGERKRVARYRDTLGNLAHSLKTPLAVIRAALSGPSAGAAIAEQVDRMNAIVEHQLKRAAASGGTLLGQAPVDVAVVAADIRGTLLKVYRSKDFAIELAIEPGASFIGDRGDLLELLGNLLDNACKWCRSRVRLTASIDSSAGARSRLRLRVEDDGPGVAESDRARVLERGARADERTPGHGIGLAMVRDTVDLYGGSLEIATSAALGGTSVTVTLPGK
jgi:two-component system sensor histidine kinase PhoQ